MVTKVAHWTSSNFLIKSTCILIICHYLLADASLGWPSKAQKGVMDNKAYREFIITNKKKALRLMKKEGDVCFVNMNSLIFQVLISFRHVFVANTF